MALNLDPIAKVAESYMIDAVTITRTEDQDKTWNPATGTYSDTPRTIYSGKAFVSPMGSPGSQQYGGEEMERTYYECGLPRTCPDIKPNDRLIVTASKYDPKLVGKNLCITGPIPATFTVHRRITAYLDVSAS